MDLEILLEMQINLVKKKIEILLESNEKKQNNN